YCYWCGTHLACRLAQVYIQACTKCIAMDGDHTSVNCNVDCENVTVAPLGNPPGIDYSAIPSLANG
ncbi:hypothetical protein QMZ20_22870, partial [Serratia bockelmannii]|nr:hypothetical protein [Serratia bockelmannii]